MSAGPLARPDRGRSRALPALWAVLSVALAAGCAAGTRAGTTAAPSAPDCSFRSAATCWTIAGRFPPARADSAERPPAEVPAPPPPVLANAPDSIPAPPTH